MSDPAVRSDTGAFALVPEWLLTAEISDRAVRLYAVLAKRADVESGECYPSRPWLAKQMHCSVDSIDRAMRELVEIGAVIKQARWDSAGDPTSNLYTVIRRNPGWKHPSSSRTGAAEGRRESAATGGREIAAQIYTQSDRDPTRASCARAAATVVEEFDRLWARYPRKIARKAALRAYQARRRAGVDPGELERAVEGFAAAMAYECRDPTKIMHGSTFFGPDERWRDYVDWHPPSAPSSEHWSEALNRA